MAKLPKCCGCEYYSLKLGTCKKYPDIIPQDIFIELEECQHYTVANSNVIDDDLPIAKGR